MFEYQCIDCKLSIEHCACKPDTQSAEESYAEYRKDHSDYVSKQDFLAGYSHAQSQYQSRLDEAERVIAEMERGLNASQGYGHYDGTTILSVRDALERLRQYREGKKNG